MFNLADGVSYLEYQTMNSSNAGSRIIEAFEQAYRQSPTSRPQDIFYQVLADLDIDPNFLSFWERKQIEDEINSFLNSY
jgi:hypothetical protein